MSGFWSTAWLVVLGRRPLRAGGRACSVGAASGPTSRPSEFRSIWSRPTSFPATRKATSSPISTKNEFEIYEDGVKQEITSMTVSHGGRVTNVLAPPPPVLASEGLILPPPRPVSDVSGRIFVFFVDDLHLQFGSTGRVRELFKKISKQLIHDGDLFGIVSSGPSSISVQMTYDKRRLDEAINKMTGAELKPEEIIDQSGTAPGGAVRGALPRRRRVQGGLRAAAESGQSARSSEGAHLRQRRLRPQSVRGFAAGSDGSQLAVSAEHHAARPEPGSQVRRRGAGAGSDPDASAGGRAVQRRRAARRCWPS